MFVYVDKKSKMPMEKRVPVKAKSNHDSGDSNVVSS